jgi:hypothetical protein
MKQDLKGVEIELPGLAIAQCLNIFAGGLPEEKRAPVDDNIAGRKELNADVPTAGIGYKRPGPALFHNPVTVFGLAFRQQESSPVEPNRPESGNDLLLLFW